MLQGLVYLVVLVVFCIIFGKFWVELGGQGPEDVARQLQSSGMHIPGFRRDERVMLKVLNRYIPPITLMGSIFVGLLAGLGDMFLGTISSGTGILLTVGIVYRMYEELAHQQIMEAHPMLRRIFG
jgi:preprotein translocase subunit SecY